MEENNGKSKISDKRSSRALVVRDRVDYPRMDHQGEYATDVAPTKPAKGKTGPEVSGTKGNTADHREEYAAEVAPARPVEDRREAENTGTIGNTVGYAGIALGILALFMWSIVLGPIAAILGFYSFFNGKRTLGGWAIGLGLVATISYFAFIPFVR